LAQACNDTATLA